MNTLWRHLEIIRRIFQMKSNGWLLFLTLCLSTAWSGCGSDDSLNRQAVSGAVQFEGEPLKQGSISLEPAGDGATIAGGATIEDGEFSIPAERGLPPGKYLVRVSSADDTGKTVEVPGESNQLAAERIPPEWNSDSQQTVQVEDGGENHFDLNIP